MCRRVISEIGKSIQLALAAGVVLAAAALPCAAQQPPAAQPPTATTRFAFVSTERVMRESAPALQAQKRLNVEIEKRDQEMRTLVAQMKRLETALEKNSPPLGETERRSKQREFTDLNRDFERRKQEYAEELVLRRNEAMGQILELATRATRRIAEQENFDIVFQEAAYASARVDITEKVIKAVNAGGPASWK